MPVIGFMHGSSPEAFARPLAAFRQGLSETGFIEDHNVKIEYRWAESQYDRLPGMAADFTIFDYNTINSAPRQHAVRDLPGGGLRFVTAAHGLEYTIVNGEVLFEQQKHTGTLPGVVLRSGNGAASLSS